MIFSENEAPEKQSTDELHQSRMVLAHPYRRFNGAVRQQHRLHPESTADPGHPPRCGLRDYWEEFGLEILNQNRVKIFTYCK